MSKFESPVVLTADHSVEGFSCGKPELDEFLVRHALSRQNARLSRTYVVCSGVKIVGYYTLAHLVVSPEEAPKVMGRGMPRSIPAVLLARLAVSSQFHGCGLGRSMLVDALKRTLSVINDGPAPVRVFVVDAMDDDARAFYLKYGMVESPGDPYRLFLSYKDILNLFDVI